METGPGAGVGTHVIQLAARGSLRGTMCFPQLGSSVGLEVSGKGTDMWFAPSDLLSLILVPAAQGCAHCQES